MRIGEPGMRIVVPDFIGFSNLGISAECPECDEAELKPLGTYGYACKCGVWVSMVPEKDWWERNAKDLKVEIEPKDKAYWDSLGLNNPSVDKLIRITHIPTGLSASCDTEKSQMQNKAKCVDELREKIA